MDQFKFPSGSFRLGKSSSRVCSAQSSIKSLPGSPRGSVRGSRLHSHFPKAFPIFKDTIEEISRTPDWIVFSNADLTQARPDKAELRRKLLEEYPFLQDAENASLKRTERLSRPRLFSFPSAPTILATSVSDGNLSALSQGLHLSITAIEERQVMRVRLVVETRSLRWRAVSALAPDQADHEVKPLAPVSSLPSAWSLPLDTRATAQRALDKGAAGSAKRTFELPDMAEVARCGDCRGTAKTTCSDCSGVEAADCFWCSGTGLRHGSTAKKCAHCSGHGRTFCASCQNAGAKPCTTCEGLGKANMGLFVDVSVKVREMPVISIASLRRSGASTPAMGARSASGSSTPADLDSSDETCIRSLASARISQLANDFAAAQDGRANAARPVMAVCEFEDSSIYTVVVSTGSGSGSGSGSGASLDPPSPSSDSSSGSPPGSTFLSPAGAHSVSGRDLKSPVPSMRSARSLFRRRSTLLGGTDAAEVPSFWTFKLSSCPGVPPVLVA